MQSSTHTLYLERLYHRTALPSRHASRPLRPVLHRDRDTTALRRTALRSCLLARLLARHSARPPSSPSTTRASLDHRHSTTVLALARDTTTVLAHDRTTAPPLFSSPPPPSSRSAPRHPFYGPVPRPRDARSRPDATTRAPVTTRALQRHAAPDHRTPRATRSRRASSPTTASSSSSLRSSPLHARMRSRPPSTITITTRSTHLSALSRTLSRNIAGLTRRSSRCHMSEVRARPRPPARPPSPRLASPPL